MIDTRQSIDMTLRFAQSEGLRRRAWLLWSLADRLRHSSSPPLPSAVLPTVDGLTMAAVSQGRLDTYA